MEERSSRRPPIVALTGIDGAGKSSSLRVLSNDPRFADCSFVQKRKRSSVDSVMSTFSDSLGQPASYLRGSFANAVRWAHAFDFLRFYEEEVVPRCDGPACVISDRWTVCSIAYAAVGPVLDQKVGQLLSCVPPADVLIHLELGPQEAIRRITRVRPLNPDEALPLLRAFAEGYKMALAATSSPVVRLHTRDFDTTLRDIAAIIDLARELGPSTLAAELPSLPLLSRQDRIL